MSWFLEEIFFLQFFNNVILHYGPTWRFSFHFSSISFQLNQTQHLLKSYMYILFSHIQHRNRQRLKRGLSKQYFFSCKIVWLMNYVHKPSKRFTRFNTLYNYIIISQRYTYFKFKAIEKSVYYCVQHNLSIVFSQQRNRLRHIDNAI